MLPFIDRTTPQAYLLFGKTGWLGGKLTDLLKEQGKTVHLAESRLEDRESLIRYLGHDQVLGAQGVDGTHAYYLQGIGEP